MTNPFPVRPARSLTVLLTMLVATGGTAGMASADSAALILN